MDSARRFATSRFLWLLAASACFLACLNVAVLLAVPAYDFHLGPLHLAAHQRFKPFLLLGGAFWCAVFLRASLHKGADSLIEPARWPRYAAVFALAAYLAVYLPSAWINLSDPGWTSSDVTSRLAHLPSVLALFTSRQADGFYRPLAFVSLWTDFTLFGAALPAYHVQSLLLHLVNALLVYKVARELAFESAAAFWSAAWFLLAAANFEPVLWPAARFDLLATAFVLTSVLCFVIWSRRPDLTARPLAISAAAFALGVFSKETAYCVPLLLGTIVLTHTAWRIPLPPRAQLWRASALFAAVTIAMLSIRISIYHGMGGYPSETGASPHFALTYRSFPGIVTRVFPLPLLGLNLSVPLPAAMSACVLVLLAALAWAVARGAFAGRREWALLLLALLSALPAINLTGWIQETMMHSRYIYLPGIFILMAAASLLARVPAGNLVLAAVVAANAAGAVHNVGVYRQMVAKAHALSARIAADCARHGCHSVDLSAIDPGASGVLFFRSEIASNLHAIDPGVCIVQNIGDCAAQAPSLQYRLPPH